MCGYSDQVHERVRELVNLHPSIFTLQTVSKAMDGYSAILQVVTVELGDRSVPEEDKLRIMLVRSPITSACITASCLWLGGVLAVTDDGRGCWPPWGAELRTTWT